jgi:adenine-specific DNA-methyltransferase
MIYIDPPYGIKFSSNWQNEVGKREVKEKDEDLSREPEMIKAYRDTWTLGVHSYLAYLKQRLIVAKELLTESGSVFVQISDENLHRVRAILDEVFGCQNFVAEITVQKTSAPTDFFLPVVSDYIIWYSNDLSKSKYRQLYLRKGVGSSGGSQYTSIEFYNGEFRKLNPQERDNPALIPSNGDVFAGSDPSSSHEYSLGKEPVCFAGKQFTPGKRYWSTSPEGMKRLALSERLVNTGNGLFFKRFLKDFPVYPLSNIWIDTSSSFGERFYVVQTNTKIVERCMLMCTDPGDLVLDPTCGSGTTSFVAEEWGRRWITIDTSRVAISIARQRLIASCFVPFKTKDSSAGVDPNQPQNPRFGFINEKIPHVMMRSIAQYKGLDSIFEKHEPILAERLSRLNAALSGISETLHRQLVAKLITKLRSEGARSITDADQRRWLLPSTSASLIITQNGGPTASQAKKLKEAIPPTDVWREWEVPFDTDTDWPKPLQDALLAYRKAWRAKMDEVNAAISANAEQEELVDQPEVVRGVVRVSGPFTVESVRPMEESPHDEESEESPIGGTPEELEAGFEVRATSSANAASHIDRMVALMRSDGVTFLGNKHVRFERLDPLDSPVIHAEGEVAQESCDPRRVAVVIGPEVGSMPRITAEEAIEFAKARRYDEVILAAFSFDAAAQAHVHDQNEKRRIRLEGKWKAEDVGPQISMALIRPDVVLGDLLKGNKASESSRREQLTQQIFTVFGQPRTTLRSLDDGLYQVEMEGVDIYDPVTNAIIPTNAGKVAAWFLDTDYDGRTFCICQAFFPDSDAWGKLAAALKAEIPEETWEALSGTESLPFHLGDQRCVAVKVIDPRGNEVIRVHRVNTNG